MDQSRIRNFSIVAHIDHGKSTLADRMIDRTLAVDERKMKGQFLDNMDLERERGITIKAQTVRLPYKAADGKLYHLNLIDTPGHVDFHYEVSRSLQACEGALLVVDASQGVEAQTVSNAYLALENNLEIVPVINKIDMRAADVDRTKAEIEEVIGLSAADAILTSAVEGIGIDDLLEALVILIPPPGGDVEAPLRALIVDSWFDPFRGVTAVIRVVDGCLSKGDQIRMMATDESTDVGEVGVFSPFRKSVQTLKTGEVGYLVTGIKDVKSVQIGDTVTLHKKAASTPLPGFREAKAMVFSGLYPADNADYEALKDAMEKLALNDSAFSIEPESSDALGFGWRCGFLGLLHMEIVQERLEREYGINRADSRVPGSTQGWDRVDGRQPEPIPGRRPVCGSSRTDDHGDHPSTEPVCRARAGPLRGKAGLAEGHALPRQRSRRNQVRTATQRDCARFLRSPEVLL